MLFYDLTSIPSEGLATAPRTSPGIGSAVEI
uniref:Uncharacterized protein n=1 Tax=mine drainage metagenome TaxID=410659 RepID=E6Q9R7_9ZZZZ